MKQRTLLVLLCLALLLAAPACASSAEKDAQAPDAVSDSAAEESSSQPPSSRAQSGNRPEASFESSGEAATPLPDESSSAPSPSSLASGSGASSMTGEMTFALNRTSFTEAPAIVAGTITNGTNQRKTLVIGAEIQHYDGSDWTTIPLSFDWADLEQRLEPGDTQEWGFPLYPEENDYPAGRYRVVLTGMDLSDEFTIGL